MRKAIFRSLFLLLFASVFLINHPIIFSGTNYYFSATGSGTTCSLASPCPISQVASHGAAGDSLLFHKGDIFTGTINYTNSGSSGSPIVFGLYGSAVNNAVLDASASSSPTLKLTSASFITINNLVIQNSQSINGALYISGGHDITLYNLYVNNAINGISCTGVTGNLSITHCYTMNCYDTADGHPNGGGHHIFLNTCNGTGLEIAFNNCYTPDPSSVNNFNVGVGDIIGIYKSNGTFASPIKIHNNNVRGGSASISGGYIGLTLGDSGDGTNGGSYQHAYNNIFCSSGQGAFGIMPTLGSHINVENNLAYGAPTTNPNNAVGVYYGAGTTNIATDTMQNNHITWNRYNGGAGGIFNKFSSSSPSVPFGWTTNTADGSTDVLAFDAMLPNPLWTGSPWNTPTPLIPVKGRKIIQN